MTIKTAGVRAKKEGGFFDVPWSGGQIIKFILYNMDRVQQPTFSIEINIQSPKPLPLHSNLI